MMQYGMVHYSLIFSAFRIDVLNSWHSNDVMLNKFEHENERNESRSKEGASEESNDVIKGDDKNHYHGQRNRRECESIQFSGLASFNTITDWFPFQFRLHKILFRSMVSFI